MKDCKNTLESNSRRVSFSSVGTPTRGRSAELERPNRQRSGTLQSVDETSEKSSDNHGTGAVSRKEQKKSTRTYENQKEVLNNGNLERIEERQTEASKQVGSENAQNKEISDVNDKGTSKQHSTRTNSSEQKSKNKNGNRYIDADMQTEIGSENGDDDESGHEADIESYFEDISFPGSVSRISMIDGPPSKEQMQRNQAQYMAEYLIQAALLAGAKDNATVMVVLFPGSGM